MLFFCYFSQSFLLFTYVIFLSFSNFLVFPAFFLSVHLSYWFFRSDKWMYILKVRISSSLSFIILTCSFYFFWLFFCLIFKSSYFFLEISWNPFFPLLIYRMILEYFFFLFLLVFQIHLLIIFIILLLA